MEPAINLDARGLVPLRLPKGFVLGGYAVDGWLRDGGMASIYRAHRRCDDQRVALKVQLPATAHDPMICTRFDREAAVMRRASHHPHVVELYEAGVLADGRRYFVMEWVEGENLEDLLDFLRNQDQRIPIVRACRIGRDVARGLGELHAHGVLHLDLKPANVMVGRGEDGEDAIKLVDFGVAADLYERLTEPHATPVMGTTGYMAPEQLHGAPAQASFDVYALGVLMFESLAGMSVPPDGWTTETLPRVETRRRGVPRTLGELVHACMDFDPARRPASAAEVAAELVRIIVALEAEGRRGRGAVGTEPARTGQTVVTPLEGVEMPLAGHGSTGGTDVALRVEVAAEEPARTGGTEVVPLEELRARSISGAVSAEPAEMVAVHIDVAVRPSGAATDVSVSDDADVLAAGEDAAPLQEGHAASPEHDEPTMRVRSDGELEGEPSRAIDAEASKAEPDEGVDVASGDARDLEEGTLEERPVAPKAIVAPQGADWAEPWEDELEVRPRRWQRWAGLGAAAAAVAVAWLAWRGGATEDGRSSESESAQSTVQRSAEREEADRTLTAGLVPEEHALVSPTKPVIDAEVAAPAEPQGEPGARGVVSEPRSPGPDGDACRRARSSATEAQRAREWHKLLRMTEQRGCWSSATQRRDRKRLRVQAYAELEEFRKCVREAGRSNDVEITSRVGYCTSGMRSG